MRTYLGSWKRLAVSGVAAVLFGMATIVWPDITLWALVVLWGAYVFVDGIAALSAAIAGQHLANRGWFAFWGLTGIAAGVFTFLWPSITALALLVVIATWALVTGVSQIVFGITMRKKVPHAWLMSLAGVPLVLLGAFLLTDPGDGALAVTWAIGWLAILSGSTQLCLSFVVRDEARGSTDKVGTGTATATHAVS